jgi:sterol 3beta-glucosyltransferase
MSKSLLSALDDEMIQPSMPRLNILLMTVGTRGDVQPFLALAHALTSIGHRCRLATHSAFNDWVIDKAEGRFEFFPLAGDPSQLSSYMTKMEGRVFPKDLTELQSMLTALPSNQAMLRNILSSTLPAAISFTSKSDTNSPTTSLDSSDMQDRPPFLAEAIIANPVAFGAIHVAQGLGIPLHMVFPQPWCATKRWPHPLALNPLFDIDYATCSSNPGWNEATYGVVNKVLWHAQSSAVNEFRTEALGLPPITLGQRNNLLRDHEVPFSFVWSKALIDKPSDWGPHIRVVGSVFEDHFLTNDTSTTNIKEEAAKEALLSGMTDPKKAAELIQFLNHGSAPIFVGFGSCEPDAEDLVRLIQIVISATIHASSASESTTTKSNENEAPSIRVVFQLATRSWEDDIFVPLKPMLDLASPNLLPIGRCSHTWLFPKCAAVVHHGGAGTVAAGLRAGKPTMIIPFVGDQFFWAQACVTKGVGPTPIRFRDLLMQSTNNLTAVVNRPSTISSSSPTSSNESKEQTPNTTPDINLSGSEHPNIISSATHESNITNVDVASALLSKRLLVLRPNTISHQTFSEEASKIAKHMKKENGTMSAMNWFHSNLPVASVQCDLLPDLPARFFLKRDGLKVSIVGLVVILAKRKRDRKKEQQSSSKKSVIDSTGVVVSGDTGEIDGDSNNTTSPEENRGTDNVLYELDDDIEVYTPVDWGIQGPKDVKQGILSALGRPIHHTLKLIPKAVDSVRQSMQDAETVVEGFSSVANTAIRSTPSALHGTVQTGLGMVRDVVVGAKAATSSQRVMQPHSGLGMSVYMDIGGHGERAKREVVKRKEQHDHNVVKLIDFVQIRQLYGSGTSSSVSSSQDESNLLASVVYEPNESNDSEVKETKKDIHQVEQRRSIPRHVVRLVLDKYESLTMHSVRQWDMSATTTSREWIMPPPSPPPSYRQQQRQNERQTPQKTITPIIPLPRIIPFNLPSVRGWMYKLGTATTKSNFNLYRYTSFYWVRRFFILRGTTLEYSLEPNPSMLSATAGPAPPDYDQYSGVRGRYDLHEVELKSVSTPVDLLDGEAFGKSIGGIDGGSVEAQLLREERSQTGCVWGDVFVPGYPNAHHHCIELKTFGQSKLGEVFVCPSSEIRDRWLQALRAAQQREKYWDERPTSLNIDTKENRNNKGYQSYCGGSGSGGSGSGGSGSGGSGSGGSGSGGSGSGGSVSGGSGGERSNTALLLEKERENAAILLEKEREIERLRMDVQKREKQTKTTNDAMQKISEELALLKKQQEKTLKENDDAKKYRFILQEKLKTLQTEKKKLVQDTKVAANKLKNSTEMVTELKKEKDFMLNLTSFSSINAHEVTLAATDEGVIHFDEASAKQLSNHQVGSGSVKRCYVGRWRSKDVAILRLVGESVANSAIHEANSFATLGRGHSNLVTCYGMFEFDNFYHLLTEYAPGGKLSDVLSREDTKLPVLVIVEILLQICLGMECLHRVKPEPIVHRDLAARNVMVFKFSNTNYKELDVKITDFGLSKHLESLSTDQPQEKSEETKVEDDVRPLRYMSPETFESPPCYSEKSDVWSFGVLMWEVLDGCNSWAPYPDVHDDDAVVAGIVGGSLKLKKPANSNNKLWKWSKKCCGSDPSKRPTFAEIRNALEDLKMILISNC